MANKRIFYATKKAGVGPVGSAMVGSRGLPPSKEQSTGLPAAAQGKFRQIHGLQSVGITTSFSLEQTFELGQLAIYENIEGIPDISIETEKVLDGYCPVYVLATSINGNGQLETSATNKATSATLLGRSKAQCDFCLAIYKDTDELATNLIETAGTRIKDQPEAHVMMSGVFVNSVSYNVGIDGYATESVTMVGQDKVWHNAVGFTDEIPDFGVEAGAHWSSVDYIGKEDAPLAGTQGSGGVNQRQDVLFDYPGVEHGLTGVNTINSLGFLDVNGAVSGLGTVLPRQIPGISASGTNNRDSNGDFNAHIQSFSCSTDFGREDIFELGRRGRYHRFVPFPTEVTCEITAISSSGDLINATEEGWVTPANNENLQNETIRLHLREGLLIDLGKKNKLSSVNVTGGDAGGGNEEITYSYTNFNDFAVYHPQDPNCVPASGMIGAGEGWDGTNANHYKANKFQIRKATHGGKPGIAHQNI